jgi:hypothetical protein
MRFKPMKNVKPGKTKEQPEPEPDDDEFKAIAANRIADMEKRIHIKTKDLEKKAQQIQGLSPKADEANSKGDAHAGPHGPIGELTLEADEKVAGVMSLADIAEDDESEEDGEEIKLVEVKAAKVAPPEEDKEEEEPPVKTDTNTKKPSEKNNEIKLDDGGDSLNDLFNREEDEENPLANLIKSLPDVTAQELIDDIKEIKDIINEWQKK